MAEVQKVKTARLAAEMANDFELVPNSMFGFRHQFQAVKIETPEDRMERVYPFVVIFQNSLDSGLVPTDWRVANVSPLFKKGGREKTGNIGQ